MDEELRKQIDDFFDPSDFAEFIGVSTLDILNAFPDETENCLDDILELMELKNSVIMEGEEE
jgi:hypothetical protein